MASIPRFINYCFRSLSLPLALVTLVALCFGLALVGAMVAFWLLNGSLPPNLVAVVALASLFTAIPMILQSMPTIRHLQNSRDKLRSAHDILEIQVKELDDATRALDDARLDLENRVERRTRELEAARIAAEDASQAKSAFLTQMSHELRTPLNAIIGFSELMMDPESSSPSERPAQVEEYAGIVHRSGKHLLSLVNDLLDMSKIEAGKIDLFIERIDLAALLSDVESLTATLVTPKNQTFVCLLDPQTGALEADRRALMQIVLNLLGNAIKYSPRNTTIVLSCTGVGDQVTLTVRDEGKGMTAEEIQQALQPFKRLANTETSVESGTGLGLYIVSSLAEAQGGTLTISSTPNVGTGARVSLPKRIAMIDIRKKTARAPTYEEKAAVA